MWRLVNAVLDLGASGHYPVLTCTWTYAVGARLTWSAPLGSCVTTASLSAPVFPHPAMLEIGPTQSTSAQVVLNHQGAALRLLAQLRGSPVVGGAVQLSLPNSG